MSNNELIRKLEERIRRLEEELSFYREMLKALRGAPESEKNREKIRPESVKIISKGDDILANVVQLDNGIKVMLRESIPRDHPAFESFMLKLLEEMKKRGDIIDFEVKESRGYVIEISVVGNVTRRSLREIELALLYLWDEIKKAESA